MEHSPLLKFMVDCCKLGVLVMLDGVPWSRVGLGPDNCKVRRSDSGADVRGSKPLPEGPSAKRPKYHEAPTITPPIMT